MALAALIDGRPTPAKETGQRGTCIGPTCGSDMVAKVGKLIRPHWAHVANTACGLDDHGEKGWHLTWRTLFVIQGADTEVAVGRHRADVMLEGGRVFEFQTTFLPPATIASRETTYGDMAWIYRLVNEEVSGNIVIDRWTPAGEVEMQWLSPRRSFLSHRRPVFWHFTDDVVAVHSVTLSPDTTTTGGDVWTVKGSIVAPDWCEFSERYTAEIELHAAPSFHGLDREVARSTAADMGLSVVRPVFDLPDDYTEDCRRSPRRSPGRATPRIEDDPAYWAAYNRFQTMPKCSVCGGPMCCGQTRTHQVCAS